MLDRRIEGTATDALDHQLLLGAEGDVVDRKIDRLRAGGQTERTGWRRSVSVQHVGVFAFGTSREVSVVDDQQVLVVEKRAEVGPVVRAGHEARLVGGVVEAQAHICEVRERHLLEHLLERVDNV